MFYAEEVLAKHDESYMPPEVADTLQTAHVDGIIEQTTQSLSSGSQAQ
jgi:cytochrome c-type biogenesis protein CcmE